MNSRKIEFEAPAGTVPEGVKAGEEFDLVCSFRVTKSGQVCLIQMGDEKMPGYSEKDKSSKPDYSDEHKAMLGNGGGQTKTGYA